VVGYVDGYVIFSCNVKKGSKDVADQICTIEKSTCECAVKGLKGAKGCIDGNGKVYPYRPKTGADSKPTTAGESSSASRAIDPIMDGDADEDVAPANIHQLAGETNCRLNAENNAYITILKDGPRSIVLLPGGSASNSRFDFKAVDPGIGTSGFYILTREDSPRALLADGTQLMLKNFNNLDGKAQEMAQWNFFINGRDADGNANYQLMPQHNMENLVLAADPSTNKLIMVKKTENPDSFAARGVTEDILPEAKKTNFNCECVF
jgi:hypothetical protein